MDIVLEMEEKYYFVPSHFVIGGLMRAPFLRTNTFFYNIL